MKLKLPIILSIFTTFCSFDLIAQAPPVLDWQKCIGGNGLDLPNKIIHSNDGGFIIAGSTTSSNGDVTSNRGGWDIWVIKTNSSGVIQWQKTFGGSAYDVASGIVQLANNDIVVAGSTSSNNGTFSGNHGRTDFCLLRLSQTGNLIWQRTYGGSADDFCYSLDLTSDGGFVLAGSSLSTNGNVTGNHGGTDFWIVKTDSLGILSWQKSFGGSRAEDCRSIKATSDGGYIASGYTNSIDGQATGSHGGSDFWVVKLDVYGILQWEKCLGGTLNDFSTTALPTVSGNYMIAGYSNSTDGDITSNRGSSDYWVVVLDSSNGNLISQYSYGGSNSDIAYDLVATADGGYILAGGSLSYDYDVTGNHGGEDFWITKTDAAGNIVWEKSYGGRNSDRPASIIQNGDGGFSVVGYTYSNSNDVSGFHGGIDIWFLKLSCLTPFSDFLLPSQICIHSVVNITNESVHAAISDWRVDDLPFSSATDVSYQFNSTGTHKISLISSTCYQADTLEQYVQVYDYPVPSISSTDSYICQGNSATLSTITADNYLWNDGETTPSISVLAGGSYSVTVTTNGCSALASYSINQYSNPQLDLGNDTAICAGASLTLQVPTGYQDYFWQDGSTGTSMNVTGSGYYSVIVSNGFCSSSDAVQVSTISNPVPVISSGSAYLCSGNSTTLSVNTADEYLWSTGETSSSIAIQSGGVYSVTVKTDGCSGSTSLPINLYANPIIDLGHDTAICSGTYILLHAQPGYQDYLWQDGSTDSIITVSGNGLFSITVSNGFCNSSDAVLVTSIANPIPSISSSSSYICEGSSVLLFTDPADNYLWNTGETTSSISIQSGGVYSVSVTTNGCSGSSSFMIDQHSTPAIELGNDTSICIGSAISLHAPPGGNLNYLWQDGSVDSVYSITTSGTYSVTISNGFCSSSDSVNIQFTNCQVPFANFTANQTTACFKTCVDFTDLSQYATSWNWFFPGAATTTSTLRNPTGICYNSPGTYSVYLIIDGTNGSQTAMMKVSYITVYPQPGAPVISANGTFLTSSHADSYQWIFNSANINGATLQTLNAFQEGYYSVRITDSNGCSAVSDSIYVGVTGVEKQPFKNEIFVYPNPSKGTFYLFFVSSNSEKTEVEVTDLSGKILLQSNINSVDKLSIQTINLEDFSNGVYLLHLKTDSKTINKKLVLER